MSMRWTTICSIAAVIAGVPLLILGIANGVWYTILGGVGALVMGVTGLLHLRHEVTG